LTVIGGFASTVFFPLAGALDVLVGWRGTLAIYAAIHLFACAPIHFFMLPKGAPVIPQGGAAAASLGGGVALEMRPAVYRLLSISLCFGAFCFTGMIIYMIEVLRALGHSAASAVFLGSMVGPAQVGIRAFELLFGHRYSIMNSSVFGSALLPLCLVGALAAGGNFAVAFACMIAYGMSNGLKAVQRSAADSSAPIWAGWPCPRASSRPLRPSCWRPCSIATARRACCGSIWCSARSRSQP
jgi:hypothetical protein